MKTIKKLSRRLYDTKISSKFNIKSGFWQIQISKKPKYKTAFTVPFRHYEWNVKPFKLKNSLSEFQHIMNNILNNYSELSIVYMMMFLSIKKFWINISSISKTFFNIIKRNGLAISASKMGLSQTKIHLLAHHVFNVIIKPIQRRFKFADKFIDKNQF